MTNCDEDQNQPRESKMLELVRKWRREVYEADQRGEPSNGLELAKELGLKILTAKDRKPLE